MHLLKKNIHLLFRVTRLVLYQVLLRPEALPTDAAQKWDGLFAPLLLRHTESRAMQHRGVTSVDCFATKLADRLRPPCSSVAGMCVADVSSDATRAEGFLAHRTDVDGFASDYLLELNQLAVIWTKSNRIHTIY